jgi:hypothetical protein
MFGNNGFAMDASGNAVVVIANERFGHGNSRGSNMDILLKQLAVVELCRNRNQEKLQLSYQLPFPPQASNKAC